MSDDLRERVARAKAAYDDHQDITSQQEPDATSEYIAALESALAEMIDNRDGYLGLYAGPIAVGMSFIWEPNKPHARQVFTVTYIEEREHDERRIYSSEGVWNDESRFREAVVAIEPAPVSVREAAQMLLDEWRHGEGPLGELCCYSLDEDGTMQPDIDGRWVEYTKIEAALFRAIAEGKE